MNVIMPDTSPAAAIIWVEIEIIPTMEKPS
jgi:hypothetical protein